MPNIWRWCHVWHCPQRDSPAHQDVGLSSSSPLLLGNAVSIALCSWQELNSEMRQHQEDLATLEHLAEELSSCGFAPPSAFQQQEKLQSLKKDFLQLQKVAKDR